MGAKVTSTVAGARAERVYRALRLGILDRAIEPGAKLPEDAIGEQLQVSRTVVREALARLASEGLVELRHNRGAVVANPSLDEARDVFAVRRAMEHLVVEVLAGRLAPAQVGLLREHVTKEVAASGRDSIRLAGEFHLLLAELTGNGLLRRYVAEVASRCTLILSIYGRPHSGQCAVDEHSLLISALERGESGEAVRLMDQHLLAVMDRALIQQNPPKSLRDVLAGYADHETAQPAAADDAGNVARYLP